MANTRPLPERLTIDEFVAWAHTRPETERWELVDGVPVPVAMAPARLSHARAKLRATRALEDAIAAAGLDCEAVIDGLGVRVDDGTLYEPDALVRCGPEPVDDPNVISDPVVVVEVISPSSGSRDQRDKLADYFRIPTLRHYLILNAQRRSAIHHARHADGGIRTAILGAGDTLTLDPPGLTLAVAALFPEPRSR
jgi:Uma2 family endonuclease